MSKENPSRRSEEENTGSDLIKERRKSPINGITSRVAAAVLAVCAGGNAAAETIEEHLGNPNNYQPVDFVDNTNNQISWCRVIENTLRWKSQNRTDTSQKLILERDFQTNLYGLETIGEQRIFRNADPNRSYNDSFETQNGNAFERMVMVDTVDHVLRRNSDTLITTNLDAPNYFDFGPVAPLWDGKIGVGIDGQDHDFYDNGDIREFPEDISGNLPITTEADLRARSTRRIDLDPDPANSSQSNITGNFAVTENYAFTSAWIKQGFTDIDPPAIFISDRDHSTNRATNRRRLINIAGEIGGVQCAYEDPNSVVLFVYGSMYRLFAGVYLKDTDADGIVNLEPDNCIGTPNSGQENFDIDNKGDACDNCPQEPLIETEVEDSDNDGVCKRAGNPDLGTQGNDNCPDVSNSAQEDFDSDGKGDPCDPHPFCSENTTELCETNDAGTDAGSDGGTDSGEDAGNSVDSGNSEDAGNGTDGGPFDSGNTEDAGPNTSDSGFDANFPDGSDEDAGEDMDSGNLPQDSGEEDSGNPNPFDGGDKANEDAGLSSEDAGGDHNTENLVDPDGDDKDPKGGCLGCNQSSGNHAENCLYLLGGLAALGATKKRKKQSEQNL